MSAFLLLQSNHVHILITLTLIQKVLQEAGLFHTGSPFLSAPQEKVFGCNFSSHTELHHSKAMNQATRIATDPTHPGFHPGFYFNNLPQENALKSLNQYQQEPEHFHRTNLFFPGLITFRHTVKCLGAALLSCCLLPHVCTAALYT